MLLFKYLILLSIYFIFYILFSLNTMISIFCFIIVIFFISILLLQLHIEYVTYLILLLYLGGILIFFLFTALMLNNEFNTMKINSKFSYEHILLFLIVIKSFFFISSINYNISFIKSLFIPNYLTTYVHNSYYIKDIITNEADISTFINLYTEKYILLYILGFILLFTMIGVIVITKK